MIFINKRFTNIIFSIKQNKMNKFFSEIFKDETGNFSSKRFVGIIAGLTLCATMYLNSYSHGDIKPADILVEAVAMLSFGCLGLASVDKIWGNRSSGNQKPKNTDSESTDEVN